jgi:hypothetical protein
MPKTWQHKGEIMTMLPVSFNPFAVLDKIIPQNTVLDKFVDAAAAKFESAKPVTLKNGVLTFNRAGEYEIESLPNGRVKIVFSDGAETVLSKAEWVR